jgi:hypothetical protein
MRTEKNWREDEIKFLKENYLKIELKEIATKLNRSTKSVGHKKLRLGLKGTFISEETKKKFGKSNEKHPLWKGDKVSYSGLHLWVKRHKPKLYREFTGIIFYCEKCRKTTGIKELELSNISGEYKRDINDYEWLCVRCHNDKDKVGKSFEELMGKEKARAVKKKMSDKRKGKLNSNYKNGRYSKNG